MLYKSTGALRLKDLDTKQGIIQAYWSAFGNEDDGGDIVLPGAFTKSINEWGPRGLQPRIKYLWQHDSGQILGKPSELLQDDTGLLATAQIVKTSLGLDVLLLYEAGVITEHSIGYETVLATFDKLKRARLLQELKLYEGSAVTWGMNSQTPTVAVKSLMDAVALADRRGRLHKLLHDAPLRTASVAARLEDELRAIEALLARLDPPKARPAVILGGRSALDALATQLAGGDPAEGKTGSMPKDIPMPDGKPAKRERTAGKARDFLTVYNTDREPWDLIEDLTDMWEALREAIIGGLVEGSASGGDNAVIQESLTQFAAKVMEWVAMAEVQSCWAEIADSAEEAQANATDAGTNGYRYWGYMALVRAHAEAKGHALRERAPVDAPAAPGEVKKGAALSGTNRDILTKAADGLAGAMADMKAHHKSIKDLLEKTAPSDAGDATGNDGPDGDGEDDEDPKTPNGGKRGALPASHKAAPDRAVKDAGTTRDDGTSLAGLLAELDGFPRKSDAK